MLKKISIGLTMVCFILPGVLFAQSQVRIIQIDNVVEMKKAGTSDWASSKEGSILERGDAIRCKSRSSAVLKWSNGSIVKVYPDTALSLGGVVFERAKKLEKTILFLERGRLFVKGQVPENIFCHFEVKMGRLHVLTQGAEFALKYYHQQKKFKIASILGRLVTDIKTMAGPERIRVNEGYQTTFQEAKLFDKKNITSLGKKGTAYLLKTSKALGGSLLLEEEIQHIGGKLSVKIGGIRNRRGEVPYKLRFKPLIRGGSGKIKKIEWSFGDGESSDKKNPEHTYNQQGLYVLILRIEDENGDKATAQISISVEEECNC